MDFDTASFALRGHGTYLPLDIRRLPPLYLAFIAEPSFSGKVHSPLRLRFDRGEKEVVEAMKQFAEFAEQARVILQSGAEGPLTGDEAATFADIMDANFDLRRRILGDDVIGRPNLGMIELARSFGMAAKFTGSGGAVVCMSRSGSEVDIATVRREFEQRGFQFVRLRPVAPCE